MNTRDGPVVAEPESAPLVPDQIERLARQRLSASALDAFYFRDVSFQLTGRTLILRGRVPTVYMRQMLGSLLSGLDGISEIDNRVNVVSATGLGSSRPR
jgi:hypothetical protein